MNPSRVLAALSLLCVSFILVGAGVEQNWDGRYSYTYSGGRNVAGTAMEISYSLTITPKSCIFTAEGYQTDEEILCKAKRQATRLEVDFSSYRDGKLTDARGNAVYQPSETLFSLVRRGGRILTEWGSYPSPRDKPHRPTIDFKSVN